MFYNFILFLIVTAVLVTLGTFYMLIILPKQKIRHYTKQGAKSYFKAPSGFVSYLFTSFQNDDLYHCFKKKAREDPERMLVFNLASHAHLILHDPALIKEFLLNPDHYVKDPIILDLFYFLLGNGLVNAEGKEWKLQKKMMAASFHFEFLNSVLPTIQKLTIEKFDELKKGDLKVDILASMQNISGEVVGKLFFGEELSSYRFNGVPLTVALADLIEKVFGISNSVERLFFPRWILPYIPKQRKVLKLIDEFRECCCTFVEERRKVMHQNKGRNDLVQILLEYDGEAGKVSSMGVVDQFISFFLPGLDTTGHMLTMAIYFMTQYPDMKEKLLKEVEEHYIKGKAISTESFNKMNYMTAFIKETLRTATPINDVFARRATKDHMLKDVLIKKGTIVTLEFFYNNYNPEYFEDPDTFNPDRWISGKLTEPYAFIPFAAGPRNCIGQHLVMNEVKLILCEFLKTFDFKVQDGYKLGMTVKFLYGPKDPIILEMVERKWD